MNLSLSHALLKAADDKPDAEALVFSHRRQDFAQLADRVTSFSAALAEYRGLAVPILAHNSDRYFEYILAGHWGGLVTVPLNWRWSVAEIVGALVKCDATVLLVGAGFETIVAEVARAMVKPPRMLLLDDGELPHGMDRFNDLVASAPRMPPIEDGGDALASIYFTGGSTGKPKGVMLSRDNVMTSVMAMVVGREVEPQTRYLRPLPMFHYGDSAWSLATMIRGGANIIQDRFDPALWLSALELHAVTTSSLVPSMLAAACAFIGGANQPVPASLEHIVYGGSPISAGRLAAARKALPGVRFSQGYGMTEYASNMTILAKADHEREDHLLASAGRANFATRLRITDPDTGALRPPGSLGEIEARGPQIMLGYLDSPDETGRTMRDGWLRTGDIGMLDGDGYLFVVDRLKDMIVTGGENVFSAEVERAILAHPDVSDVAVIGIPHDDWGEAVHAVVLLHPERSITVQALRDHCATTIARFKCPRSVEFVASLPMTPFGKISKPDLRSRFWPTARQIN